MAGGVPAIELEMITRIARPLREGARPQGVLNAASATRNESPRQAES
jgi:hypothetical protein